MVVRGGMVQNICNIYYIDIYDIVKFLTGVSNREGDVWYTKNVLLSVTT
jgi:hypothetical protein